MVAVHDDCLSAAVSGVRTFEAFLVLYSSLIYYFALDLSLFLVPVSVSPNGAVKQRI